MADTYNRGSNVQHCLRRQQVLGEYGRFDSCPPVHSAPTVGEQHAGRERV
jgi:hypothetical protein